MTMPISISSRFSSRAVRLLAVTVFLLASLFSVNARAVITCTLDPGAPPVPATVFLQGSVTVGRDVPVGAEIYRASFHGNPTTSTALCTTTVSGAVSNSDVREYATTPLPLSGYVHPQWGPVYQTNVPGIGVVFWFSGQSLPYTQSISVANTNTVLHLFANRWFDASFIKTGPVSPGTISAVQLPTYRVRVGDNNLTVEIGSVVGSLNIVSRTCTTPDVNVDLGTHYLNELSGVGTHTSAVVVPIKLSNCPAFWGQYANVVNNDPNSTTTAVTPNTLTASVTPVTSIVDSTNAVMALQPDGVNPTATGIGIQLMAGNQTAPQQYNQSIPITGLNQTDGAGYELDLYARYYQTGATVSAGQANGAATVTLIYN